MTDRDANLVSERWGFLVLLACIVGFAASIGEWRTVVWSPLFALSVTVGHFAGRAIVRRLHHRTSGAA